MAQREGQVAFVVAGSPPSALAIRAEHVRRIAPEHSFTGELVVDLRSLGASADSADGPAGDGGSHVLVVGRQPDEIGVLVRGRIRFLVVERSELLPLPATIERPSRMSHVIASGGVPRIPVVDLTRLGPTTAAPGREPHGDSEKSP
jgi:hypothetical protein